MLKRSNKKNCMLQPMSVSRYSVAQNYFWLSLRILFTAFLETETQLWKLMWVIWRYYIGSSGSPLHSPLLILSLLMGWYDQRLKLLKVASLQYLYSISKKKLGMEVIFGIQINVKVSTSWHYPFWRNWPGMFKIPKIGSW